MNNDNISVIKKLLESIQQLSEVDPSSLTLTKQELLKQLQYINIDVNKIFDLLEIK